MRFYKKRSYRVNLTRKAVKAKDALVFLHNRLFKG